ncbi:MAG TPA: hypothetical protein VK995_04635 [Oceanipulchritudo sp.]|nr:hypothetical protein [Oceanipulchritudo sp.]
MNARAGVIDVGSNSIKALVAESAGGRFGLKTVFEQALDVRISQGIGGTPPMLKPSRIAAGVDVVVQLWQNCHAQGPLQDFRIVATSAVRSAANGQSFLDAVEAATGCRPVILTGAEEADGIANGIRTDPSIASQLDDFTVFDLGGGSLELIRFVRNGVANRTSLPLGSVRLTEKFISNPVLPVPAEEQRVLTEHVKSAIQSTGFPLKPPLVGCSGGLAVLRRVMEGNKGKLLEDVSASIPEDYLKRSCQQIVSQGLDERIGKTGLPADRADIFPAAMLTFVTILDLAGAHEVIHSLHNLRYGIAWALLSQHGGA